MKSFRYAAFAIAAAVSLFAAVPQAAQAAGTDEASKYIQSVGDQALGIISDKAASKEAKQAKLSGLFGNAVDFQWVGRFVLGRYWKQVTDAQKNRYVTEYQKFLLLNYTSRFTDYTSGTFRVTNSRDDGDNEFTVSTQMQAGGGEGSKGEPVLVDYRIRKNASSFKIFDVIVEGVSLLTTQRTEFSSVINDKGIDYLIDQLASKSATVKH